MKKIGTILCALVLSTTAFSQTETTTTQAKTEREVIVTEVNGVKRLEETTIQNGVTRHEVFEGVAAENRLATLKKEAAKKGGEELRINERKKATNTKPTPTRSNENGQLD